MERFDLEVKANNLIRKMIGAEPYITQKSLTNADRIRAMTDEELAEFMSEIMYCHKCWKYDKEQGICTRTSGCNSAMLEWLKQEVDNG